MAVWRGLSAAREQALRDLAAVQLVAHIPACVCKQIACEVVLSRDGSIRLSVWDSEVAAEREAS